jgi:uncharacterized integral membrane protein
MGNLWLKIKIWFKVAIFSALAVYAVLFIWNNRGEQKFWIWFGYAPAAPAVLFMFLAFVVGVLGTILVRMVFGTISQIRELRQRSLAQKTERRLADMEAKANRLQTRPEPPGDSAGSGTPPAA